MNKQIPKIKKGLKIIFSSLFLSAIVTTSVVVVFKQNNINQNSIKNNFQNLEKKAIKQSFDFYGNKPQKPWWPPSFSSWDIPKYRPDLSDNDSSYFSANATSSNNNKDFVKDVNKRELYHKDFQWKKQFTAVNVFNQKLNDQLDFEKPIINVGIIEINGNVDSHGANWIKPNVTIYNNDVKSSAHANLVASIIAGVEGIDANAKIFSASLKDGYSYQDLKNILDWMVQNDVQVINHSYGIKHLNQYSKEDFIDYSEKAYLLDHYSRRYGIVHVFGSGNSSTSLYNAPFEDAALAFNTISVGAVDNTFQQRADYSSFTKQFPYEQQPKPLVLAPGDEWVNEKKEIVKGTSYSAPVVTGIISLLMRNNPKLKNNPEAFMALLAVAANPLKLHAYIGENGFSRRNGAGIVDYAQMQRAIANLQNISLKQSEQYHYTSKEISLESGDMLSISAAWLYNAGYLEERDYAEVYHVPFYLWLNPYLKDFLINLENEKNQLYISNFLNSHIDNQWLKKEKAFDNLMAKFEHDPKYLLTNYDVILKKYNEKNQNWEDVYQNEYKKTGISEKSNVELIQYINSSNKKTKLRFEIVKKTSNKEDWKNAGNDKLAFTHVIRNQSTLLKKPR